MALVLAWVALTAGCGGEAGRARTDTSPLARAERSLQSQLEAAAEHLGMRAQQGIRVGPTRCEDRARRDVTSGYRLRLELRAGETQTMLRRAEQFWRARGRHVRVVGARGSLPAVFATADPGWTFSLQLFPERGEALLSGGTPCLPDPRA